MTDDNAPSWPLISDDSEAPVRAAQDASVPGNPVPANQTVCPACGQAVQPHEFYCQACGSDLKPKAPEPRRAPVADAPTSKLSPVPKACTDCGGSIESDGYCTTCGAKAAKPRDHFEESPTDWLSGVCDRGVTHPRNEDAMALWASEDGSRGVVVVCDGVSTSADSDVAALAGARRARDVLSVADPAGLGTADSRAAAWASALVEAASEGNTAVVEHTAPDSQNAAACTFVAAVIESGTVHLACIGDSRAYWVGTDSALQLTVDDSVAQEFIAQGMSREEAEHSLHAHAITRWLGRDSDNIVPTTTVHPVTEDGWLVVCSDGLWNYASYPDLLADQVRTAVAANAEPVQAARALVRWANAQGGKDNVTVVLAHCTARLNEAKSSEATSDDDAA